jgi:E-phenylitaconyl-CoA hydratase
MSGAVKYVVKDRIGWIHLNRPDKRNAINLAMRKELQDAFTDVKFNKDVWVAVLTGEGSAFCSGKDLTENVPEENVGIMSARQLHSLQMNIYKPVICAINGACYNQGVGFALNSDIIIMSDKAQFGWPQSKYGIGSVSGPSRGVHILPWHVAMFYIMRAKPLTPAECLQWGLASQVVPHDELLAAAQKCAEEILENAPLAIRYIKESARNGMDLPLAARMQIAQLYADAAFETEDAKEGIAAFKARRKPVWKGK